MSSATEIDLVDDGHHDSGRRRRVVTDSSLIVGIILIAMFLGFFVLEFSQILSIAGSVHHVVPARDQHAAKSPDAL